MKRVSLIGLGFAFPGILLALLVGGESAAKLFVVLTLALPAAFIGLAPGGQGRRSRILVVLGLLGLFELCGLILLVPGALPLPEQLAGLPGRAWVLLLGLGLVPLILVATGFAVELRSRQP